MEMTETSSRITVLGIGLLVAMASAGAVVVAQNPDQPKGALLFGTALYIKVNDLDGSALMRIVAMDSEHEQELVSSVPLLGLQISSRDADGEELDSKVVVPLHVFDGYARFDMGGLAVGNHYQGTFFSATSSSEDCTTPPGLEGPAGCFEEVLGFAHFIDMMTTWQPAGAAGSGTCTFYPQASPANDFPSGGSGIGGDPIHADTEASYTNADSGASGYAHAKSYGDTPDFGTGRVFTDWFASSDTVALEGDFGNPYTYASTSFAGSGYSYAEAILGVVIVSYNTNTGAYSIEKWAPDDNSVKSYRGSGQVNYPGGTPHAKVSVAASDGFDYNGQLWVQAYVSARGGETAQATAEADFNYAQICV